MTKETREQYTNLPENILPTKEQMIEYILEFQAETGATYVETDGTSDIISWFRLAQDYFRPKAKPVYLDTTKFKLDRFED